MPVMGLLTDIVFVDGKQNDWWREVNRTITRDKVVSAEATEAAMPYVNMVSNKAVLAIYSRNKAIVIPSVPVVR